MTTALIISFSFLLAVIMLWVFEFLPWLIPVLYIIMSGLTFLAYFKDKASAQSSQWRIPENTLHLLALLCGWPGALVAQQSLRHKTQKEPFRRLFWLTTLLNVIGFLIIVWFRY